jgi:hypothetical protein
MEQAEMKINWKVLIALVVIVGESIGQQIRLVQIHTAGAILILPSEAAL